MRSSSKKNVSGSDSLSTFVLASIIKHTRSASQGKILHNYLVQHGQIQITFLRNCLIEMYGNCGTIADARSVFDNIQNPNLYSYNLMIRSYALNGNADDAQNLFNRTPNPDVYTWNLLLKAFIKHGALHDARKAFECMPYHNIVAWTAMIAALAHDGRGQEALELFYRMHTQSLQVDQVTFLRVLDACSSYSALTQGQEIHAAIVENGFGDDSVVATSLVSMYGKCESLAHAKAVFFRTKKKDIVCWTAMPLHAIKADNVTYLCALNACSNLGALEEGQEIHMAMAECEIFGDVMLTNSLINLYGKSRRLHDANYLFHGMADYQLISWNILISVHVSNGLAKESLVLLQNMQQAGIEADNVTFAYAVEACSSLADLKEAQEIHANLVESGCGEDPMICSALLKMYGKCKSTHDAVYIFENMKEVDVVSWTALIGAYVENGSSEAALSVFRQMQGKGLQPDDTVYVCALDACRAGQLEEAEHILQHLSIQKADMAWLSLLGACRIHNDYERALHAAEKLSEWDNENSAPLLMLAGMFAAS
ncbi:hypothetical protein GOP47_0011075 [Adiantum capillus-veneris]|uniref:Pentatricopeptide repeat-containing protein n=1 Tax=Adiantum capillus-veneris TaxID=13818 RepID=A0A9D4UT68_ADICA|nr:hypothetical protein GOP47_0011075 [Adiantum capillus-veneris]